MIAGRRTAEAPGRMLALVKGGEQLAARVNYVVKIGKQSWLCCGKERC
nr:hypothetical protein [Rosenbergiella nectarea]